MKPSQTIPRIARRSAARSATRSATRPFAGATKPAAKRLSTLASKPAGMASKHAASFGKDMSAKAASGKKKTGEGILGKRLFGRSTSIKTSGKKSGKSMSGTKPSKRTGKNMFGAKRITRRKLMVAGAGGAIVLLVALPPVRRAVRRGARSAIRALEARFAGRIARTASPERGTIDPMTGLLNHLSAAQLVADSLHRAARHGHRVALLHVDVDDFTAVNETFGDDAGDHVLQVCAARLEAEIRDTDQVCRLHADNFLLVVEPAGADPVVARVAERIADSLSQPITFHGETILVTASIGIAISDGHQTDPDHLMRSADHAVGRARASGRRVMQS